jgi:drug/metabolite transporter (DMT)-like permease
VPAAFTGTYVSMSLFILGMKLAPVTTAALLNQTSTIFTLILAAIFLKEPLTARKVAAILLGFAGAFLSVQ